MSGAQARAYAGKAEEFLAAATAELKAGRTIAATSLAIHAGINAADALTGVRLGKRAAGQDHDEVLNLLRDAGQDGAAAAKELMRLLPMKRRKRSTSRMRCRSPPPPRRSNERSAA